MKHLFFLLAFSLLLASCENESINNNDSETPALIIKEMLVINETYGSQELSFFNTLGQLINNDEYLNSSFVSKEKVFYNSDNQRDSTYARVGFESEHTKYNYENGLLTNMLIDPSSQAANISFNISYDGNEMTVLISNLNSFTNKRKYIFSDENRETLLVEEYTSDFGNNNDLPNVRREYMYDSNSNLIQSTSLRLNDESQIQEVISVTQYTYDDKKNPFKSLPGTHYLIINNSYLDYSSVIFDLNHQSNNNILSKTVTTEYNPRQWIYEYEYNELDFPTNIIESQYLDTTGDDVLDLTATLNKTLTYYDN